MKKTCVMDSYSCRCRCEKCGVIPLSCFSGEEQFQRELASVRNCGEVKTGKHKTNLSAILKLTPFLKNSSSPTNAGEGKMRTPWAAFTLAEVLITLTIIGVIAVLTIPNLMKKWEDQHTVSAVKEAYLILNNAYKLCINENGTMENWDWGSNVTFPYKANPNKLSECMLPYLKVQKYCGSSSGCAPKQTVYTTLDKVGNDGWGTWTDANLGGKMLLQNGMYVAISSLNFTVSATGVSVNEAGPILVDINGNKLPNRYGYDVFFFWADGAKGIRPLTSRDAGWGKGRLCNIKLPTNSYTHLSGRSCAAWIISKGNVDYKYRDVSAEW